MKHDPETETAVEQFVAERGISPLSAYAIPADKQVVIPGITRDRMNHLIEAVIVYWRQSGTLPNGTELQQMCPEIPRHIAHMAMQNPKFHSQLELRGVIPDKRVYTNDAGETVRVENGLTGRQLLALSQLTDVSSSKSLNQKLKDAGIQWSEWQLWMSNKRFREAHDKLAEDVFRKAQASVDLQVASGALDGRLDFIKYYNEITGRHDPKRRAHQDVQTILRIMVDIIMRNVTDPAILAKINEEIGTQLNQLEL